MTLSISIYLGVWCSYDPGLEVLVLDTEGMLGSAANENVRTRMLLKERVLAFFSGVYHVLYIYPPVPSGWNLYAAV